MDKGLRNDRGQIPSLSSILNNSIRIHSETTIGQDGNLQFYCGLKLTQNTTTGPSTLTLPRDTQLNPKQNTGASTFNYHIARPDVVSDPVKRRYPKKNSKKAAFTSEAPFM
ncbi:hypothetical protein OROMI_010146 [Orobanche minor]